MTGRTVRQDREITEIVRQEATDVPRVARNAEKEEAKVEDSAAARTVRARTAEDSVRVPEETTVKWYLHLSLPKLRKTAREKETEKAKTRKKILTNLQIPDSGQIRITARTA